MVTMAEGNPAGRRARQFTANEERKQSWVLLQTVLGYITASNCDPNVCSGRELPRRARMVAKNDYTKILPHTGRRGMMSSAGGVCCYAASGSPVSGQVQSRLLANRPAFGSKQCCVILHALPYDFCWSIPVAKRYCAALKVLIARQRSLYTYWLPGMLKSGWTAGQPSMVYTDEEETNWEYWL